uniref:Aldedh domain-containing protein n=1 Tax=Steinernema glaseri TaxID=37863 RepID=A0A1I7YM82_9BILA
MITAALRSRTLLHSVKVASMSSRRSYKTALLPRGAKAFINGHWVDAFREKEFEVLDPYSNELLYDVSNCDVTDAENCVMAARQAFPKWSLETTAKERSMVLRAWSEHLIACETELASLLTREQGKPLAEARGEVQYAASFFDWYAGEARRIYGQIVEPGVLNRQHFHTREPIGVVAVITPWNFPIAMIARKAAAAIAAGCTLVVKPAEDTPLSALALAEIAKMAGLPDGVFNVLPADRVNTAEISKYLCSSVNVDAISFTGSTAVGKILLSQSASTVKRVCLENGGNAPLIVFSSADIGKAVKGTMASKFRCSGQTCVSANRVFAHKSVHDEYIDQLKKELQTLVLGHGMERGVNQGPLINRKAVEKVQCLVDDATAKGAKVIAGGKAREDSNLFEPTILVDVDGTMEIANQEIFGPVIAVQKFEDEEEVLKTANNSRSGLAGYVFSNDASQLYRVTRRLQVGMLGVNEGLMSCAEAAFGGVKESGLGREGGPQGIDEFTQWKYICIQH